MELSGLTKIIHWFTQWYARFLWLNLLWITFSIAGIGVSFMPSTMAMFAVMKCWVQGKEISVFKVFWENFRTQFLRSNLLGMMLIAVTVVLYFDYQFSATHQHHALTLLVEWVTLSALLMCSVTITYLFPVAVHYRLKLFETIKVAFCIGIAHPFRTALTIFIALVIVKFCTSSLVVSLLVGGSLISFVLTWNAMRVFELVSVRRQVRA